MVSIENLQTELQTDPLEIGYVGMTDEAIRTSLYTVNRDVNKSSMTGSEIMNAIDSGEFNALVADDQQRVWNILHLSTINPFGVEATMMTTIFGGSSVTIMTLAVIRKSTVSRASELGLGRVALSDITKARS